MMEHQHIISSHHKEMQTLRDSLALAMQRCESLSNHNVQELKEFKEQVNNYICLIKEKMIANGVIIADQKKTIESLHQQLNEFHEIYARKKSIEKLKSDFDLAINYNTISHINSFQEFQREIKSLINSIQNELNRLRSDTSLVNGELDKKIDNSFHTSRLERDSVLKQVRTYEKIMFIIEKKIENIYTLIERINERIEVCHKQA
jgi:archaellum component FlaC